MFISSLDKLIMALHRIGLLNFRAIEYIYDMLSYVQWFSIKQRFNLSKVKECDNIAGESLL